MSLFSTIIQYHIILNSLENYNKLRFHAKH